MAAPRKIGNKRILIGIAIGTAILLALFYYRVKTEQSVLLGGESTYTVARQDMLISVVESGSIKARNSVTIRSGVEGRTTIVSIVPEGTILTEDDVKNGKVILELDTSTQKEDLNRQQIEYNTAMAGFTDAKENLDIQKNQNESDIQQGRLTVKFALMDLQKYVGQAAADQLVTDANSRPITESDFRILTSDPNKLGGESLQKYRQLTADISMAMSEYKVALTTLNWTEKLYAKNYVAKTELDSDQLKADKCKITHEQALTALDLFIQYEFPKDAHKLYSDYAEAKRELERILAKARSQEAQAVAKRDNAEAKFALEKERLEKLQRQVAAGVIKAPTAGMVVYATQMSRFGSSRSRTSIEVGRDVYEREEIISIPNTTEMAVDTKVHETNVDKVSQGQITRITVDALPDQVFYGQVLKIAPLPDPAAFMSNPDLKIYTTEVSLAGGAMLRPGMSAKVEIIIAQLKNVVAVPIQCIANRDGKKICYVKTNSSEAREVKTGPYNDKFVQILEGLKEGEKVLLNPPRIFDQPQDRSLPQESHAKLNDISSESGGAAQNGQNDSKGAEQPRRQRPEGQSPGAGQPSDGQTERPRRQRPEGQAPAGTQQQSDGQTERPRRHRGETGQSGAEIPQREPQQ